LAKVKEVTLKRYQESLRDNGYWTSQLIHWIDSGKDNVTDFEQTVNGITAEDVRLAVKNLIAQGNDIEIVMSGKVKAGAEKSE
jgi:zinc protease